MNLLKSSIVAVAALALGACAGDSTRNASGQRVEISEPEKISPAEATTNLPRFMNLDRLEIERYSVNNGQMIVEKYYVGHVLVGRTESVQGRAWFSRSTAQRLEDEEQFRETLKIFSDTRVYEADTGFYTKEENDCALKVGKKTRTGRMFDNDTGLPDLVVALRSCDILRVGVEKVVENVSEMSARDEAVIAARLESSEDRDL